MRRLFRVAPGVLPTALVVVALASGRAVPADTSRARRLDALQDEMKRLQGEMTGLAQREQGLLGDVARMDAEIALRRAELEDNALRLRDTEDKLAESSRALELVSAGQAHRAPVLAARLREIYKRGPAGLLARAIAPLENTEGLDGFRYAAYLSRRDALQLSAWRSAARELAEQRTTFSVEKARLSSLQADATRKEAQLTAGRNARASLLTRIRGDREKHERALAELEEAARNLGRVVDSVEDQPARAGLNVRKFKGLLDWPAEGAVSAKFGTVVHPRFKTEVPHPGLDLDAAEGRPFRTVFDGRVAYAAPLNGYGLTVVVDHGNGVVSIYAHAAVLLVEAGESVVRDQELGRVGDSGSLRGVYLYFEMREAGKPVDPSTWLRRR
jgi:murein hydrolase activator